jgi:hypothetical protein
LLLCPSVTAAVWCVPFSVPWVYSQSVVQTFVVLGHVHVYWGTCTKAKPLSEE